jgi:hypothetical protein
VRFRQVPDSPDDAVRALLAGFVPAVRDAVACTILDRPAGLLALSYLPGSDTPMPIPAPRPDEPWEDDPALVLNPAEWDTPEVALELDAATREASETLEHWLRAHDAPQLPREIALAAAKELGATDWHSLRPVADDFLVYAIDVELKHLNRNLPEPRSALTRRRPPQPSPRAT